MEQLRLYRMMARVRAFELATAELWHRGLISGEMHLGTGEEAVIAGVMAHLGKGDAVALDHRPTPALVLLGVDPVAMLKEMLGHEDGLCGGWGGHMHLLSPAHLAASSGIVGAAGPTACGFALSARHLRKGKIAVATFGDGATNQGQLLEAFNLAVAWKLPLLFVCKDNGWAITTRSDAVTGGDLPRRAEGFGLPVTSVDGLDPVVVHEAARQLIARARAGKGPGFLHAKCLRADGHFLNDPLLKMAQSPIAEGGATFKKVLSASVSSGGGGLGARAASVAKMVGLLGRALKGGRDSGKDPLVRTRKALRKLSAEVAQIDHEVAEEMAAAVAQALGEEVPR